MSIEVGSDGGDLSEVMVDINTTPLIDVMLVLLIMLILTVPVLTHAVRLDLPVAASVPPPVAPAIVRIEVAGDGTVLWDGEAVATVAELERRFRAIAVMTPQPEVHLRPDAKVRYGRVATVMAAAQRARVTRFGIVGNERFMADGRP
jgi:biopolymer transport protein ExbD